MSSDQQNGTPRFSGLNDFTKASGAVCRPLSEKEILGSRCSQPARKQNRQLTAKFECFTSPSARTAKIFSLHSANSKSAESNSNSRITRFRTPSIFVIPTVTSSRSRPTSSIIEPAEFARTRISSRSKHRNDRREKALQPIGAQLCCHIPV